MRKVAFFLIVGLMSVNALVTMAQQRPGPQPPAETGEKFKVGMAGYSFARVAGLDKALETMQRVDVHYLCIKDFHLPFTSTDEQIAEFHAKLKAKGVTGYAVGPIYM